MKQQIEFWYEFASTYSYPSAMRAEEVADMYGVAVLWRPFLLGPIFQELGWNTSPFNLQPAKGAYMWRDLERTSTKLGLTFTKPRNFPQNGLLAARIATALDAPNLRSRFSRAVFHNQFALGESLSDMDCLSRILEEIGCDAAPVIERAKSQGNKVALREETAQARTYGIFGAPTWRTPDGELFWGNDRLEDALDWIKSTPVGCGQP